MRSRARALHNAHGLFRPGRILRELMLPAITKRNPANNNGDTALIHAARQGHTNVVNLLLNAGADPAHVNAAGDNALDCAKREKRKGVVALLQGMGVKRAKQ